MKVFTKLLLVQQKLKAPKNLYNSFGKYKYRNCEGILEAVKPYLAEVNAVLTLNDEIAEIGGRIYVKAIATFIDAESGEIYTATAYARESAEKKGMDDSQITGATSSYARKYALNGLFLLDDTKDADDEQSLMNDHNQQSFNNINGKSYKDLLLQLLEERNIDKKAFCIEHNLTKSSTEKEYASAYLSIK